MPTVVCNNVPMPQVNNTVLISPTRTCGMSAPQMSDATIRGSVIMPVVHTINCCKESPNQYITSHMHLPVLQIGLQSVMEARRQRRSISHDFLRCATRL
jgi:hypothetical protein